MVAFLPLPQAPFPHEVRVGNIRAVDGILRQYSVTMLTLSTRHPPRSIACREPTRPPARLQHQRLSEILLRGDGAPAGGDRLRRCRGDGRRAARLAGVPA